MDCDPFGNVRSALQHYLPLPRRASGPPHLPGWKNRSRVQPRDWGNRSTATIIRPCVCERLIRRTISNTYSKTILG